MLNNIELHRYCELYPPCSAEELGRLAEDIIKHGLLNPIVLLDGQILDGRNRYEACRIAKVEPRFKCWHDLGLSVDPLHWAVSQNSNRRHLNASQLAMIGVKVAALLQEDAHARMTNGTLASIDARGKSTELAAKIVGGVSPASIERARAVEKASPELADKVLKGELSLNKANAQAKETAPLDASKKRAALKGEKFNFRFNPQIKQRLQFIRKKIRLLTFALNDDLFTEKQRKDILGLLRTYRKEFADFEKLIDDGIRKMGDARSSNASTVINPQSLKEK